jgi:hypothetical protein
MDKQGLDRRFGIVFEAGIPLRRALAARLFTGAYHSTINDIAVPKCCSPSARDSCDRID